MALKHQSLIDQLTLEEKAQLTSGQNFWNTASIERLGIPSLTLTDGPHGLRKQAGKADHLGLNESVPATCFPTAAALANSWNSQLIESVGRAIGQEAAANQVGVLLGPGLNIVRDPLAGRNFEYFSEDPLVSGVNAAAMVRGIESTGVAACLKHYAVNSQEHLRMSIDEIVDERSLREIYLEGFRHAIKHSDPRVLMTSYNKVNSIYANENQHLLQDILFDEWGYRGLVVTDWGGNNDRIAGLKAGNHLEMPSSGGVTNRQIIEAVNQGKLDVKLLDQRVDTILELVISSHQAIKAAPAANLEKHHDQATEAARQSIVLLKNSDDILPLNSAQRVAIIGDFADKPRYQGAGSSLVNPTQLDSPLDCLSDSGLEIIGYQPGYKRFGGNSKSRLNKALGLAAQVDKVVVFIGLSEASEAEGLDRQNMRINQNQINLVNELSKQNENIIVVLVGGAPMELPFADDVQAIIYASLTGQGSGRAISDVLTGKTNPSAKLAVSWPYKYDDSPTAKYFPGEELTSQHREAWYVGYRYYDSCKIDARYEFGYGISYTSFEYSDLVIKPNQVMCRVTNTGSNAGQEIVQVYIAPKSRSHGQPVHELKGYEKTSLLKPGESQMVNIELSERAFMYFDTAGSAWRKLAGQYDIEVGASSRDIKLRQSVQIEGDEKLNDISLPDVYLNGQIANTNDDDFQQLLDHRLPPSKWDRQSALTLSDTISQLRYQNIIGKMLVWVLVAVRKLLLKIGKTNLGNNVLFVMNLPFNKIERLTSGRVKTRSVQRFLRIVRKKSNKP